jgi:hypothetical protein
MKTVWYVAPCRCGIQILDDNNRHKNEAKAVLQTAPSVSLLNLLAPFLYCMDALRALVIAIVTASGRDCHVTAGTRESGQI